jgi:hypothetical protein
MTKNDCEKPETRPSLEEPCYPTPTGGRIWGYINSHGKFIIHRESGPAFICSNGDQYWYFHDLRHREDGPALVRTSGLQKWFRHGLLHRIDGPAAIYPNGTQEWYQNGQFINSSRILIQ